MRVQAVAGPDGNTARASDGDPSAWTFSPQGEFGSRRPGGELWGIPPEVVAQRLEGGGGRDGGGLFAPWEGYPGAPALRTSVAGLDRGDYHVFLLWQDHAQQTWPVAARLVRAEGAPTATEIVEQTHPDRPLALKRRYLGTVRDAEGFEVEIDGAAAPRSRYVGVAYAPAAGDYPLPPGPDPAVYPYGYPYGDYPLGGASHPRQSGNYFARPPRFGSGQTKRIGQYALRQVLVGRPDAAIEYAAGLLAEFPGRYDDELHYLLALGHAQTDDPEKAAPHLAAALAAGLPPDRFLAGPRHLFDPVRNLPAFARIAEEHRHRPVHGPMLGAVDDTGARIWVRTAGPATVRVTARPEDAPDGEGVVSGEAKSDSESDYTAVVALEGLRSATAYRYSLEIGYGPAIEEESQRFRTTPPRGGAARFSVAFGGGAGYVAEHERMWDTIRERGPDALLLLGDNVYIDDPESPEMNRYCYYQRQSRPEFRRLVASTPVYAIWDDHDFACDDSWGGPDPELPYWKPMVWDIFRQNWVNPAYGDGERPGVWFDFSIGDVHFLMLDGRTYREDAGRFGGKGVENPSMLGEAQLAWLLETLASSKATFKVLVSPVPWSDGAKPGGSGVDTWRGYSAERERIFSFLEERNIGGVLLLAADRHRSDAWVIERSGGPDLHEFMSSRLTNEHTHLVMEGSLFGYNEKPSFGLVHFDTASDPPKLRYEIVNIEGETIHSLDLSLDQMR